MRFWILSFTFLFTSLGWSELPPSNNIDHQISCLKISAKELCQKNISFEDLKSAQMISKTEAASWIELHGGDELSFEYEHIQNNVLESFFAAKNYKLMHSSFWKKIGIGKLKLNLGFMSRQIAIGNDEQTSIILPVDESRKSYVTLINSEIWRQSDLNLKQNIVLHNLLIVGGYDDRNFQISKVMIPYFAAMNTTIQANSSLAYDQEAMSLLLLKNLAAINENDFPFLSTSHEKP